MKKESLPWIVGIVVTIGLALNGYNMTTNAKQEDVLREHEGDIASISAKIERIPYIEEKVDALLEMRSVNPRQLEMIIEQNLSLKAIQND